MTNSRLNDSLLAPIFQGVGERILKLTEPRFVVAPTSKSGAVDRLANLLGAWSVDCTLGLEVAQAALFERQVEIVEQTADLAFEVINQVVVDNAMNEPGGD